MLHTVLHRGVPVGVVDLTPGELVSGRLEPTPAYLGVAGTVRAGSEVLLMQGFFGAVAAASEGAGAGSARARAVAAAAALRFELEDAEGRQVAADFVNLLEAPEGGVVVIARLRSAPGSVAAARLLARAAAGDESDQPEA